MSGEKETEVLLETRDATVTGDPSILLLRLNRPAARNALNLELREQLADAAERVAADSSIRCVVLTGNDQVFAAGADVKVLADATPQKMMQLALHRYWQSVANIPQPVIAAVEGWTLGAGCELAMHADIIVSGETGCFGQPEVKLGIMPGAGGTQRLVRAVGRAKAMRMLLTGELINAQTALEWGLISDVVPTGTALASALMRAKDIVGMPPIACRLIKETVTLGADLPLEAALAMERKSFQLLFDTADQKEGMDAFLNKRSPEFKGS